MRFQVIVSFSAPSSRRSILRVAVAQARQNTFARVVPFRGQSLGAEQRRDFALARQILPRANDRGCQRARGVRNDGTFDRGPSAQSCLKKRGDESVSGAGGIHGAHGERWNQHGPTAFADEAAAPAGFQHHFARASSPQRGKGSKGIARAGERSGFVEADEQDIHAADDLQNFLGNCYARLHADVQRDPTTARVDRFSPPRGGLCLAGIEETVARDMRGGCSAAKSDVAAR